MITMYRARILRELIEKAAASLPDEDALNGLELYPEWQINTRYEVDFRVRRFDKLYRVAQEHTSQADWLPEDTPALYVEIAPPGVIPVWKQPAGAHDAYNTGDKVRYPDEFGTVWISTVDANVWEPGVYGWEVWNGEEQPDEDGGEDE